MQTLLIGLDAFDASLFEKLSEQGRLPNLTRHVEAKRYSRFTVANPPQSEVSWTSIATGLNPGGHGMFDFVHRDPATYRLGLSLLPVKQGLAGTRFVPPYTARTIFDEAVSQGFPATALWWPAMFPGRPESPVRTLPGLGTPDIQGRLGVGTLFTTAPSSTCQDQKTPVVTLKKAGQDRYAGCLAGPIRKTRTGTHSSTLDLELAVTDGGGGCLRIGQRTIDLSEGIWSPILELSFKVGRFMWVKALTRVILSQLKPDLKLYFLPLQLHPLHSLWRYAAPPALAKQIWNSCGPFLTLGWPQDTTGLEEQCITDTQFLDLCDSLDETREQILMHQLTHFREGILASVFDSLDRVQHMFWRDRPDIVEDCYVKLDSLVGRVTRRLAELGQNHTRVVIVSDHGFADYSYKVHLNQWLVEQGFLCTTENGHRSLKDADWSRTEAYAVGLNSVYVNLAGREGQGLITANQYVSTVSKLRTELLQWQGPDGRRVVSQVRHQAEAFEGPFTKFGPDLVVGFSPGYRASAQTGLGEWKHTNIEANQDHWGGDHCIEPQAVPGVLFSTHDMDNFPKPSYHDIPALTVGAMPRENASATPCSPSIDEDEEVVEERLRSLGYL